MHSVYFGHHKCASTWIDTIIKEVVKEHGYEYRGSVDHETPQGHGPLTDYSITVRRKDLAAYVVDEGIDVMSCLAADHAQVEALRPLKGVHVIRDPRDIIVSGYFSHKHSHPVGHLPHMAADRQQLQEVSKDEGLLLGDGLRRLSAAGHGRLGLRESRHPGIKDGGAYGETL